MKEILIFAAAGVAALATFTIIAKKFGSNCTP
jgi:hypothetical protein